eukprot:6465509-Amphidinium_carterae.1
MKFADAGESPTVGALAECLLNLRNGSKVAADGVEDDEDMLLAGPTAQSGRSVASHRSNGWRCCRRLQRCCSTRPERCEPNPPKGEGERNRSLFTDIPQVSHAGALACSCSQLTDVPSVHVDTECYTPPSTLRV